MKLLSHLLMLSSLSAGTIFVSNENTGLVSGYDSSGVLQQVLPFTYNIPTGLAVDSSGALYVTEFGADTIYRVDVGAGTQVAFITQAAGSGVFALAFDDAGNAYVTSRNAGVVSKYDSTGAFIASTPVARPRGITYDPYSGNLLVATTPFTDLGLGTSDSIVALTTGLSVSTFSTAGVVAPRYVGVMGGTILLSNGGLEMFSPAGANTGLFAAGPNGPNQIAVDLLGAVYVTEYFNNTVLKCTAANTCSVLINQGPGEGVHGLAIAPEPTTSVMLLAGVAGLALFRRRRS